MSKLETYSDLQFEKQSRFGLIKMKELICKFGNAYLLLIQNRVTNHPLGSPFVSQSMIQAKGTSALKEQKLFIYNHHALMAFVYNRQEAYGIDISYTEEENLLIHQMKSTLTDIIDLLRKGMTNPNTEAPIKPVPWTPLMCAAAFNDVRSARLMMREGADPNHPNRDGTTSIMIAAQLNNLDVLLEFLMTSANLNSVDNEGFTPLAYAGCLPLPTIMEKNGVEVILDGESSVQKFMNSSEMIKLALKCGVGEVKKVYESRLEESKQSNVEIHLKFFNLLEKYGLSRLITERSLHDQVRTGEWRIQNISSLLDPDLKSVTTEDDSEIDIYEEEALKKFQDLKDAEHKTKSQLAGEYASRQRCPVCTLKIPCPHFFKLENLTAYLQKKELLAAIRNSSDSNDPGKKYSQPTKKMKSINRAKEILEEAHLGDRNTDRSVLLANTYRHQDILREKQIKLLKEKELEELSVISQIDDNNHFELDKLVKNYKNAVATLNVAVEQGSVPGSTPVNTVTIGKTESKILNSKKLSEENNQVSVPPPTINDQSLVVRSAKRVLKYVSSYNESGKISAKAKRSVVFGENDYEPTKYIYDESDDLSIVPLNQITESQTSSIVPLNQITEQETLSIVPLNSQQTSAIVPLNTEQENNSNKTTIVEIAESKSFLPNTFENPFPSGSRKIFMFKGDDSDHNNKEGSSYSDTIELSGLLFVSLSELQLTVAPSETVKLSLVLCCTY